METNKFFIEISYLGTHFHGWQIQENANSVQEILQDALSIVLRKPIGITGCGRTDTGVHAYQHYSHFYAEAAQFGEAFIHQINSILPHDISVKNIIRVHESAHARFDPVSRIYEYRLYFKKNPFQKGLACYFPYFPNLELMTQAAEVLKEYSDFSCFSKTHTQVKTHICTIFKTKWYWDGDILIFEIEADRFLRNMVRAIVGTLLQIGWGEINIKELRKIILSGDRSRAGASVSPEGLYLKRIIYPYELLVPEPIYKTKKKR
jgi:tRNA pseudouridine38-40 synthase